MDLDLAKDFGKLDPEDMLGAIRGLPQQLWTAWETAGKLPLPEQREFSKVLVAGMGGSAIGADILAGYAAEDCSVPLVVLRGYQLPAWAKGADVLVVCSSHSGNTEETLAVFEEALERGCTTMTVSTGGKLSEAAKAKGAVCWNFDHVGQPRTAVGFSFGLLLNLLERLDLLPKQEALVKQAVEEMEALREQIDAEAPAVKNLAKRLAGQAVDRIPVVFGAEHLEPVARRWKTQINEVSKAEAQFEFLPEADHNTLAGLVNPEELLYKTYALFLNSERYYERIQKRFKLTADEFMVSGVCVDPVACSGGSKLAEIWTAILLGDYVSFYLAMAYEVDPTPVDALNRLKAAMKK
ncbi:MAG: glucose/mannose-6-phosphate isomerase [Chloroflexota bacterium]|nr:glucose/mannose-6-phosphate isomerase [Chloroflexota bacterium]